MSALDLLTEMNAIAPVAKQDEQEQVAQNELSEEFETQEAIMSALQLLGSEDETSVEAALVTADQIDTAWDVLDRNIAMLNMHVDTLLASAADGGISQQTLGALTPVIEQQCGLVGAAFLHYSNEQLDKPGGRIDAAEYSAESIKKAVQKGYERSVAFFDRIVESIIEFFKKHVSKVGRFKMKADKLAEFADKLSGTPGDKKVTVSKELFLGNKMVTVKDLEEAAKMVAAVAKDGKTIDTAIKGLADAYSAVKVDSDADAQTSTQAIDSAVNDIADAIQSVYGINNKAESANVNKKLLPKQEEYAEVMATDTLPGNFVILLGKPGDKSDRMPAISVLPTEDKVKAEEIPALGKAEIVSMAKAISELAESLVDLGGAFDSKAANEIKKGAKNAKDTVAKGADSILKENATALTDRIKQMRQVAKLIREPASPVSTRLATVGMAAYNVAYRSAKAHKAEK